MIGCSACPSHDRIWLRSRRSIPPLRSIVKPRRSCDGKGEPRSHQAAGRSLGSYQSRVRTMMSYLRITAPFSGMVTKRYADTGAMIQAGTASQTQAMPVIRLSQVNRLRLVLPVPESVVTRVRIGGPVEVRVRRVEARFSGPRIALFRPAGHVDSHHGRPKSTFRIRAAPSCPECMDTRRSTWKAAPMRSRCRSRRVSGHDAQPTVYVISAAKQLEERQSNARDGDT